MFKAIFVAAAMLAAASVPSSAGFWQSGGGTQARVTGDVGAPPGFREACRRYGWLCSNRSSGGRDLGDEATMAMASKVNSRVNRAIRQVDDSVNYGVAEHWVLPTNGTGDCEDLALLKKKELIENGIDPRKLMMAVALDRRGNNHAVLLLRLSTADVVLDSLTGRIVPWNRTGYRFLAKQMPNDKSRWGIMAGPDMAAR